jgi:crotonyl-CoA reductase
MGAEAIIDRKAADYRFWKDEHSQDPREWKRFGKDIRELTGGEDVDIVFEHPGRETFGASVYVTRKGGTIVTCASTSGYEHTYDNRYLWMSLKRIVGSHFANYREAWEANRLITKGMVHPTLSKTYSLEETGQAAHDVHRNVHQGKVGVLCLAPREGMGVRDEEKRAKHADAINLFRAAGGGRTDKHSRAAEGGRTDGHSRAA